MRYRYYTRMYKAHSQIESFKKLFEKNELLFHRLLLIISKYIIVLLHNVICTRDRNFK